MTARTLLESRASSAGLTERFVEVLGEGRGRRCGRLAVGAGRPVPPRGCATQYVDRVSADPAERRSRSPDGLSGTRAATASRTATHARLCARVAAGWRLAGRCRAPRPDSPKAAVRARAGCGSRLPTVSRRGWTSSTSLRRLSVPTRALSRSRKRKRPSRRKRSSRSRPRMSSPHREDELRTNRVRLVRTGSRIPRLRAPRWQASGSSPTPAATASRTARTAGSTHVSRLCRRLAGWHRGGADRGRHGALHRLGAGPGERCVP